MMKSLKSTIMAVACMILLPLAGSAQTTVKYSDPEIASIAVTANQIDVDYGKIALNKSQNPEVVKFAKTMINDHENIIKLATDLAKKLNVTPKDNNFTQELLKGAEEMTQKLKSAKGDEFNKIYIENEVAYHDAVVGAVKSILIPQTENKDLKELLKSALPLLEHHLEMAKMAQKNIIK